MNNSLRLGLDSQQRVSSKCYLFSELALPHDRRSRYDHFSLHPLLAVESVDSVSDAVVPAVDDFVRPSNMANVNVIFCLSKRIKNIMLLSGDREVEDIFIIDELEDVGVCSWSFKD